MIEQVQTLVQEGQAIVRALLELLVVTLPMPWRVSIFLLSVAIILNLVVWRLLPWLLRLVSYFVFLVIELLISLLLFPEYLITRQLRRFGWGPLWGTYLYGDLLGGIVRLFHALVEGLTAWQQWRFPWFAFMLLIALPVGLWFVRPYVEGMAVATYIDASFQWWYGMEVDVLNQL